MPTRPDRSEILPPDLRIRLQHARDALFHIHKLPLDLERNRYEATQGAIEGSDHFLQLVIGDSWSTPGISSLRWTGRRGLGAAFIRSSRPLPPSPAVTPTPSASSVTAD